MTPHDIDKLLAEIAAWKAAVATMDAEYEEKRNKLYPHPEFAAWRDEMHAKIDAAKTFVGTFGAEQWDDAYEDDKLLAAFTALADHCAQLTRERDALAARIERAMAIPAKFEPLHDFTAWDIAVGWNEARDEFRKELTDGQGEA